MNKIILALDTTNLDKAIDITKKIKDKIWSKTLTKSDLQTMTSLCCCSIPTEEQNFWIKVFFGLTTVDEKAGLEIDDEKQLEILDPDGLSFEKFKISEYEVAELSKGEVTEDDSILDGLLENQKQQKEHVHVVKAKEMFTR